MVATRSPVGGSQGHYGGGLVGGATQANTTVPSWSDREQKGKKVSEMGDFQAYGGPQGSGGLEVDLGIYGGERRMVG